MQGFVVMVLEAKSAVGILKNCDFELNKTPSTKMQTFHYLFSAFFHRNITVRRENCNPQLQKILDHKIAKSWRDWNYTQNPISLSSTVSLDTLFILPCLFLINEIGLSWIYEAATELERRSKCNVNTCDIAKSMVPTCKWMILCCLEMLTLCGCPLAMFRWSRLTVKGSLSPPRL